MVWQGGSVMFHDGYSWINTGVLFLLYFSFSLHILFTKRDQPGEAAFWLMAVLLIPIGGAVAYLMFGIVRLKHVEDRVNRLLADIRQHPEKYGPGLVRLRQTMKKFLPEDRVRQKDHNRMLDRLYPEDPPLGGNNLEMLRDGVIAYPRMLADIRAAKHCVRLQSYILMSDKAGKEFMDACEECARRGVDVKIIFDSLGSLKSYYSHYFRKFRMRKHRNFQIRAFSPFHLFAPWRFQLRNHRKVLLVDGKVAYSGGINISEGNERSTHVPPNRHIHDLHCRITGPAVVQFTRSFFLDWSYTARCDWRKAAVEHDFPLPDRCGDTVVRVLGSGPGDNFEGTRQLFSVAAVTARRSLWIMTPYFVPGPEYVNLLCLTAARGVDVRVIVPASNDHVFMDLASSSSFELLLESGVRIYRKRGVFSHIKALLADGEWGFMGSSNCDSRSFRLNFELNFCFEESKFSEVMRRQFEEEMGRSDQATLEGERAKGVTRKLGENIFALFTPIL